MTELDDALPPPSRRLFCNRTLNLRSIDAIGFDMDYTLVHYNVVEWERRAYEHCRAGMRERGYPVDGLEFDPEMAAVGLVIDTELGNVVKANRFGFVKRAAHGSRMLEHAEQRSAYERRTVDLAEKRWYFVNTLFGMSEACLYMQLVDRLDEGQIGKPTSYVQLFEAVRASIDEAHMEGQLKAEVVGAPERFVEIDPELPRALEDLRAAGKKLLLVTNSDWSYTRSMMSYAFDRFLGAGRGWRALFDLVIVSARKPAFFTERMPAFEILDDAGRLWPASGPLEAGKCYVGGHARLVETSLGVPGEELLYVGDHVFSDVNVSKSLNRWRTCLVLRDLEAEIDALEAFKPSQRALTAMMEEKERLEHRYSVRRLAVLRAEAEGGGGQGKDGRRGHELPRLRAQMRELRAELVALDERIAPLAKAGSELHNRRWGLLLRTGNDKSHLARQIERHADVYTSRVSNFLLATPFVYLRSPRGSLPHDSGPDGGVE